MCTPSVCTDEPPHQSESAPPHVADVRPALDSWEKHCPPSNLDLHDMIASKHANISGSTKNQQKITMPSTCTIHANTHASMKESPFQANIHETSIMRHQIISIYYEFNYMVITVQLMQMTERIKPGAWGHMSQKGCNSCTLHPVVRPLPGEAVSGNLLLNKTHCILHQCYFIPSSTIQHEYFTST